MVWFCIFVGNLEILVPLLHLQWTSERVSRRELEDVMIAEEASEILTATEVGGAGVTSVVEAYNMLADCDIDVTTNEFASVAFRECRDNPKYGQAR